MRISRGETAHGVTLIEMLIVLAIIAILGVIAYPSYQDSVRKAKRAEGRAALALLMQQQEIYYSRHNSYIKFSVSSSEEEEKKFKWFSGNSAKQSAYEIKGEPCAGHSIKQCVILIAMPGTENVDEHFKDPECGDLTLTSTGVKMARNPRCWS